MRTKSIAELPTCLMFWTQTIALQTRCEETRYDLVSQNFEDVSSMMKTNGITLSTLRYAISLQD